MTPTETRTVTSHRSNRITSFAVAVLAAFSLVLPTPAQAQELHPAQAAVDARIAELIPEARQIVAEHVGSGQIPGLSVAVAIDGQIVWSEGFGLADVENRVPVWPETKFRIASISKSLTAAAMARLYEEGRLDLDAEVQEYVPGFPRKDQAVTVRQVAGHLAGIRHYRGNEFASAVQYDDVVDALAIFEDDPLLFPPGERYSYSTYGWNLLSAVVQGAAGAPFLEYMRAEVIEPLGLRHTLAEHADSIIPHRARFYQRGDDGLLINAPYVNNSNKWAGGGYLSTAEDMVRYGSAYLTTDFFQPATVELFFTSQRNAAGEEVGYGIGWRTGELNGTPTVWHTGGAMGGSTVLLLDPASNVVVSILTNVQSRSHTQPARALADLFSNTSR